jgi:hypothetical protein
MLNASMSLERRGNEGKSNSERTRENTQNKVEAIPTKNTGGDNSRINEKSSPPLSTQGRQHNFLGR